ncbi:helix-turn-helix transcriptional regulator [Bacillus alveayuensis]|uniref:helix-turn-helix transcriptional regulator n=1 Tax=Aeribacillus alveayuensis TaxID=279215 RepID=UPI000A91FED7|nr:PAS domain-containing protein [Bacillus alveayuensis]
MHDENALIFDHAIRIADILVKMFGSSCEVAVHDFSNLESSLIYLAGTVTGRDVGSPATDLVLQQLKKKEVEDFANYKTTSPKGEILKSSTIFLKNQNDDVIGAICINYDISLMIQLGGKIKDFIRFEDEDEGKENFYTNVQDVIRGITQQVLEKYHKAPALLETEEKIEVIKEMDSKGVFLIKGAIGYIASVLGVSKFTIYNYLQKIRTEETFNSD